MRTLLYIMILAVVSLETSAQDLKSFYAISGFNLPALRSGQYYLSLSTRYLSSPGDFSYKYSYDSPGYNYSDQNSGDYTYSTYGFNTNFTYGISDITSISFGIQYNPYLRTGEQTTNGVYIYDSGYETTYNEIVKYNEEILRTSLILSHRFRSNIEFSVSAYWNKYRTPYSGDQVEYSTSSGVTPTSTGSRSSTDNRRYIDIYATIVILGY